MAKVTYILALTYLPLRMQKSPFYMAKEAYQRLLTCMNSRRRSRDFKQVC